MGNLDHKRRRGASRVFSFRADSELAEWVAVYCYREEISESQLIVRALRRYRNSTPEKRRRQRDEAMFVETRLTNRYLYRLLADRYGEEEVKRKLASVREEIATEARELFLAFEDEEG
jgi:hypothetical protein